MMGAQATTPDPAPTGRSLEVRFLSTWLPLSVVAAAVLGFETWLGPKGAYYALAVLPLFPLFLAVLYLVRHPSGTVRTFTMFLVLYLALEWAAEIYYLWHWVHNGHDPAVPSPADYCWLASCLFLIWGCWGVAAGHRGLRLQAKDAFVHGVWLASAATILLWVGRAVIASDKTPSEAVVLCLYPFVDAVVVSLILVIRGRNRSQTARAFWFVMMIASLSILVGDFMWLWSKSTPTQAEVFARFGDAFYILAYLVYVVAVWAAFQLERVSVDEIHSAETDTRVRQALSAGGINSLASLPIVVVLVLVLITEKGVEHAVVPMLNAGPVPLLLVSGIMALGLKVAFWKWEKQVDAVAMYRQEFRKRLQDGGDLDPIETAFLDRLRVALHMTPGDARAIEARILQEREEELRAQLEVLQREKLERRSAEEWQAAKSEWLSSIRSLNAQLDSEVASQLKVGDAHLVKSGSEARQRASGMN